ncbi:unnamed protein product [Oreochromis niloticus]|nr:unnamed protein product [Mustela putorius furo]
MYPEWEPGMGSGRGGGLSETPNLSAGLLGPAPMSSGPMGGMSSSWGGGGGPGQLGLNKLRSRVVVVKYDRKPLSNKTLFAFAERFGCLREHLILKNKAFLEMSTHEEALDVVNYYKQHPASLYGKPISFYLSQTLMFIEKDERSMDRPMDRLMDRPVREVKGQASKVVFFSNLPREDEKKKELLTIAERFGVVEKHLFLTDQAFIQLGTAEDAEMLVKYYTVNSLTIRGRRIRLNVCTKYKTLNVNARKGGGDASSRKSGKANSTSSGTGTRTSSKTTSSKSSTRSKEDKKREEKEEEKKKEEEEKEEKKVKAEPEEEEEEEEKEVSGVMEGGEDGEEEEEQAATDGEGEEPEGAESVKETVEESEDARQEEEEEKKEEEKVTDDVTDDTPGDTGEVKQEAESEPQTEATETSAEEHESKEEANMEAAESSEAPEAVEGDLPEEEDFPENMEDFVTLDELEEDNDEAHGESDDIDNTRRGGMRVVNIVGFRRGYQYLNELLRLAQPFGKVVKHLVLDLRPEAFLQFATEEEARAMASFYNGNITASVCGRPVRISHSMSYPTIQSGSSKVVYIGQLPNSKYTDEEILKFAEPFGKVKKYFLNRIRRECFLEMYNAEDAEKMAADYKAKPPKLNGKRLTIYVSRKYKQLKHGHRTPSTVKRASDDSPQKFSKDAEEPPAKKPKEEAQPEVEEEKKEDEENQKEEEKQQEEEMETPDVSEETAMEEKSAAEKVPEVSAERSSEDEKREELVEQMETSTNQSGETEAPPPAESKPSVASMPLPPYDPNTPIGVEHVKAGFYCRICFLFYSNEDTAKKTHCSSQAHYDKLQKYLEKEQSKAEKKVKTTTP